MARTVIVTCDRCGNKRTLNCEISSQWNAETDTLTFTATAGETYTNTQTIKLTVEGGKLTVTMSALGADDAANMIIMIAGYSTNGQMSGCQVVKEVTGMTEKILTVTGDTTKVFFLKFGSYAPLFECVEP